MVQNYGDIGLSSMAYCEKRGIYRSLFYYYIRKFDENTSLGGFAQVYPSHQLHEEHGVLAVMGTAKIITITI